MHYILALLLSALLAGCGGSNPLPAAQAAEPPAVPVDATAQLQALLDSGRAVIPAGVYNVTSLRVSKPTNISCAGADVDGTVIRFSGEEGLVVDPTVVVNIATGGWNKRGFWFRMTNCRIEPQVKGGGKHPVVWRVRPGFFISSSHMRGNHLGGAGAQGLWLDNSAGNVDGIFTSTFSNNFIENGVLVTNGGDSLHFIDNVVPQGANAPGLPGYDLSFVPGAAESSIVRGNITGNGGCVVIRNGQGIKLDHVWCESPGKPAGTQGTIAIKNCIECKLVDTRIQTFAGDSAAEYALTVENSPMLALDSNKFNKGKVGHVRVTGSPDVLFYGLNSFDGARAGLVTSN